MKKVLSFMLAFVMLASLALTGCSGSGDKEPAGATDKSTVENGEETEGGSTVDSEGEEPYNVVIAFAYLSSLPGDLDLVEAAINEITLEKINCTVTLKPVSLSEVTSKFSLWVTDGEKVDMVSTFGLNYTECIENGSIVRLDEMLEEHAPYLSSLDEMFLGMPYKGGIYGLPVMQRVYAGVSGIGVRTDIMKEVGLNYENGDRVSYEELDEMFALVHEAYPEMIVYGESGAKTDSAVGSFFTMEGLGVAGAAGGVLVNPEVDTEIVNVYKTEEYREHLEWMRKWFLAGYISSDASTSNEGTEWAKAGRSFSFGVFGEPGCAATTSAQVGQDITVLYKQEPMITSITYSTAPFVIPITSERPEKALEFMDLMFESKELANLIQHGVEGLHYEMTDQDMIIEYIEGRAYENPLGLYGNKMNVYMSAPNDNTLYQESADWNEKALENVSTAVGYRFISEGFTTELAAITNVLGEYCSSLEYGYVEIDEVLPQFLSALEDAGIDKVIAENQRQFDEWRQSQ